MPVYGRDGYMQRAVVKQYISVVSCVGEMVICGGLWLYVSVVSCVGEMVICGGLGVISICG